MTATQWREHIELGVEQTIRKLDVAFRPLPCLKRASPFRAPMPKILIGISMLLMTLSFVFGFLNTSKLKGLRNELTISISAREISDRARTVSEKKLKARETDFAAAQHKATAAEAIRG